MAFAQETDMVVVPTYQDFMNPVLAALSEGQALSISDLAEKVSIQLALSESQKQELTPGKTKTKLRDRVHWAAYYLKRAGCLTTPKRGVYQINQRGKELQEKGVQVDSLYLEIFPEFQEFIQKSGKKVQACEKTENTLRSDNTPDDEIKASYMELKQSLADELLDTLKNIHPKRFEKIVTDVLLAMGYGGGKQDSVTVTPYSNDGGIDGILKEDPLGLEMVYVQAKRYTDGSIGRPEIQAFVGSLEGKRAKKGVFITTSTFTKEAKIFVEQIEKRIILIDGEQLAYLMIDYGVGVSPYETIVLQRIDNDYFDNE